MLRFSPILLVYFSQRLCCSKKEFITLIYICVNLMMIMDITEQIINSLISFIPTMCVGYNSNFLELSLSLKLVQTRSYFSSTMKLLTTVMKKRKQLRSCA